MRWAHEPLLHFLGLGALLFGVFALIDRGADEAPQTQTIVVDADLIADRIALFHRTWQRPPRDDELEILIESWVREEIFYREGLALGLDRDDPVVRRRVAQKLEFMADGVVSEPDETELEAWLANHPNTYRLPAKYAFEQRAFAPHGNGEDFVSRVANALAALKGAERDVVSDLALLPDAMALTAEDQIARAFGSDFVTALGALPEGEWAGPVASGYGLHLVRVARKVPARMPSLDEVRTAVERDVIQARTAEAKDAFYRVLLEQYTVQIEANSPTAELQSRN